jgi:Protein of unknown function (DUF2934)
MKKTTVQLHEPNEPNEAEIQKKAYHLWIEGGRREGVELDNWFAAKELLRHHHGGTTENRRGRKVPVVAGTQTSSVTGNVVQSTAA